MDLMDARLVCEDEEGMERASSLIDNAIDEVIKATGHDLLNELEYYGR